MTNRDDTKPLNVDGPKGPAEKFMSYCLAEFERRKNMGDQFDESAYREAMEMTVRRLRAFEEDGLV